MKSHDQKILLAVKILLGLCLLTPLFFASSLVFPFTPAKVFSFRILVEIAAALYFYLALKNPALRPKKTALNLAVLVFLAATLISGFAGIDPYLSFWGNAERMGGFFTLAHLALYFLMLQGIIGSSRERDQFLKITAGASALVALTTILQRLVDLGQLMPQVTRPFGLIGNAGFLGTYLVFNIFIAAFLCFKEWKERKFWPAIIFGAGAVLEILALILSGTRGAFLGLAAGVLAGAILAGFYLIKETKKRWVLTGGFLLLFLIVSAGFVWGQSFFPEGSVFDRLTDLYDVTGQNRILLWRASWDIWQERLFLGFGPENFEAAFDRQFIPELGQFNSFYDRAHNFIFDYGVTVGFTGLLSYLAMIVLAGRQAMKDRKEILFSVFIVSVLIAYLVQNFFLFDSFVSFLMLFFVLGILSCCQVSVERKTVNRSSLWLVIFLLAGGFLVYAQNLKPWQGVAQVSRAMASATVEKANKLYESGFKNAGFARAEMAYQAVVDYLDKIQQTPELAQNEDFFALAQKNLQDSIETSPEQSKNYIALAWLDLYFSGNHPERVGVALELTAKARELSTMKLDVYSVSLAGYALSGQAGEAERLIQEISGRDQAMGLELNEYWQSIK